MDYEHETGDRARLKRYLRRVLLPFCTAGFLAAPLVAAPASEASRLGSSGLIAFASDRSGDFDIYLMGSDGSGLTQLTDHPADEFMPSWSPDGAQIAFVRLLDSGPAIFVTDVRGTPVTRLTYGESYDYLPVWSPDGKTIAFVSDRHGGEYNPQIYAMNPDGTRVSRLTDSDTATDSYPTWSPDGTQLAFVSDRDGTDRLYLMNADGTGVQPLTDGSGAASSPAFSPDGGLVAFTSSRDDDDGDLYVLDSYGEAWQLTDAPGSDDWPTWSSDGTGIAFASTRKGNHDIRILDENGERNVTSHPATDLTPAWQPLAHLDLPDVPSDGGLGLPV